LQNNNQIHPIFKSKFKDVSDSISQIFFIKDFTKQDKNSNKFSKAVSQLAASSLIDEED